MRHTRHSLFEFMPYGAPELLSAAPRHMSRALVVSSTLLPLVALTLAWCLSITVVRTVQLPGDWFIIEAPPPIADPTPKIEDEPPPPPPDAPPPSDDGRYDLVDTTLVSPPDDHRPSVDGSGDTTTGLVIPTPRHDGGEGRFDDSAGETRILRPFEADVLPNLVRKVEPVYPDIAKQAGAEGDVVLEFVVERDGRVGRIVVVRSAPMFDEAAIEAVRGWVFTPALSNNHPVAVWLKVPIRFRLH